VYNDFDIKSIVTNLFATLRESTVMSIRVIAVYGILS